MTELQKKTKIRRLTVPMDRRLIFLSDIHGDLYSLKQALEDVKFCPEDYLFFIGDIYEKGDEGYNLKTIRFVMDLVKSYPNVYPMAGNCDEVFRFILPSSAKDTFLYYANVKKRSVINDIAAIEKIEVSYQMDVEGFINMLKEKYNDLFDFMDSLDDVIFINDSLVLVHGGIDDINHIPEYSLPLLKYDRFYEISAPQPKIMIVGHYPTRNYRSDVSCVNPIFDFNKKIISIDGGDFVVKGGQLNVVYLDSLESMKFHFFYVDHYEKRYIQRDANYEEPDNSFSITYGDNEVKIIDTDLDYYLIEHLHSKMRMWVNKAFVYEDHKTNKVYCYDASNQFITVRKGDLVSIIKKGMPYSVIKHKGYIGLIETKYLDNDF